MPSRQFHQGRRSLFLDAIESPVLLMAGGWTSRNYPANPYAYRADSNFLYFFDRPEPRSAALFDPQENKVTLFLTERTADDALWHGAVPGFDEMKEHHGTDEVVAVANLSEEVTSRLNGRAVQGLAVRCPLGQELAREITGQDLHFYDAAKLGSPEVLEAIAKLRLIKTEEEIDQMRSTAAITRSAHLAAMAHTRVGNNEQDLTGRVEGIFTQHNCVPAYNTILSVRGEVLHNNDHSNELSSGDIVLLDAGAESAAGYASDVTRAWPVDGKFSPAGADIYDIVLAAEKAGIEMAMPGTRYRDVHLKAALVIAEGLIDLGILRGNASALVESGAHAVFFPHGVGHHIGLDVHDLEAFGDLIHYPGDRQRSSQFGTGFLRMDRDLEAGNVFTIEPGIYFVPAILENEDLRSQFSDQVDFVKAERFLAMNDGRGFGGIRIEDDVHATAAGPEVLTHAIPKERVAVEGLVDSAQ